MVFQYVLRVLVFSAPINLACIDTNENTNRICGCPRTSLDFTGHKKRPGTLVSSSIPGLYGLLWIQKWCRGTESNCPHGDFQSPALPTELPRHDKRQATHFPAAWQALFSDFPRKTWNAISYLLRLPTGAGSEAPAMRTL